MKFLNYLIWLLFPKRCACCNNIVKRNENLCEDCNKNIERITKLCIKCGCDKKHCCCGRFTYHFRGLVSPFNFGDVSSKGIYILKFGGSTENADFFAESMAKTVIENYSNIKFNYILSVPLHPLNKFKRGYNQSEILARKISKILGVPYVNYLKKIKRTKPQHKSNFKDRFSNIKDAYVCKNFKANNVLLVDDIKTTGATLDECARQIMFAGANNVYCVTALSNYKKQGLKNKE
ncbi:MAG: ComF family protein [Clostridia bacterium]|nr:ComF family protein [Clostridia bacterium]